MCLLGIRLKLHDKHIYAIRKNSNFSSARFTKQKVLYISQFFHWDKIMSKLFCSAVVNASLFQAQKHFLFHWSSAWLFGSNFEIPPGVAADPTSGCHSRPALLGRKWFTVTVLITIHIREIRSRGNYGRPEENISKIICKWLLSPIFVDVMRLREEFGKIIELQMMSGNKRTIWNIVVVTKYE